MQVVGYIHCYLMQPITSHNFESSILLFVCIILPHDISVRQYNRSANYTRLTDHHILSVMIVPFTTVL